MAYKAPVRDFTFILNEVLEIDRYTNQPGFQDVSSDLVSQILEEGAKFADEVIAPINNPGDKEGCHWAEGGVVTGPKGWKEAYKAMSEAGWMALAASVAVPTPMTVAVRTPATSVGSASGSSICHSSASTFSSAGMSHCSSTDSAGT